MRLPGQKRTLPASNGATKQAVESQVAALRRQLAAREAEIDEMRAGLEMLRGQVTQRDGEIEGELYELAASVAVAGLEGSYASHKLAYFQMIRRLREQVQRLLPRDAKVAIVSKGDANLTRLFGRRACHFPQDRKGDYAGFYPGSSLAAIAQLEAVRSRGCDYFILPSLAFWWLDKYPDFARHLERRHRLLVREEETCLIYALGEPGPWAAFEETLAECRARLDREPVILDLDSESELAAKFPECVFFSPGGKAGALPYLDRTIDLVALRGKGGVALKEARRVCSEAVLHFEKNGSVTTEWRSKKAGKLPSVSIIIPCHDGIALTESCLRSLRETLPAQFRGEIIVVDDASTDDTPARLAAWASADRRVKIIRNPTNLGFLGTANRGAAAATGEFLIFLNNDTLPLPGWLPPLLRIFRDFPQAGAVGGKLIFPDGTIQEAGGMMFRGAEAAHFGREDHALDAAIYNFVREVDYCSAALLATPRALFEKIGGFDRRYEPAYYEDTDYCFAVHAAGRGVFYQPESAVVHLEGASCGTDHASGLKRYQRINQAKFAKKWSKRLARLPKRLDWQDVAAWRAHALRGPQEVKS